METKRSCSLEHTPFRSACSHADINLMGLIRFEDLLHSPINMLMYFPIIFFLLITIQKMSLCLLLQKRNDGTQNKQFLVHCSHSC